MAPLNSFFVASLEYVSFGFGARGNAKPKPGDDWFIFVHVPK